MNHEFDAPATAADILNWGQNLFHILENGPFYPEKVSCAIKKIEADSSAIFNRNINEKERKIFLSENKNIYLNKNHVNPCESHFLVSKK